MKQQFLYFLKDVKRMLGKYKIRILHVWLSRSFVGIFLYRFERGCYLTFGRGYEYLRIIFIPFINMLQAYSNLDLHYKADIGGGMSILHPSAGVVVSGMSIIGSNLTLTGGNVIGLKAKCKRGDFVIGNNCSLGANAVILGPVILSDNINIGALACVTKNCLIPGTTLVGVPAR